MFHIQKANKISIYELKKKSMMKWKNAFLIDATYIFFNAKHITSELNWSTKTYNIFLLN